MTIKFDFMSIVRTRHHFDRESLHWLDIGIGNLRLL